MTTIGYVRSALPNPLACDHQERALRDAGAVEVYRDDGVSGNEAERPAWDRAVAALHPGDLLLVTSTDRVGRSAEVLRKALAAVSARGAEIQALDFGSMHAAAYLA